jgi:hypothetical protein
MLHDKTPQSSTAHLLNVPLEVPRDEMIWQEGQCSITAAKMQHTLGQINAALMPP